MTLAHRQPCVHAWEEKRAERFQRWLSPPGVAFDTPAAADLYRQRVNRFIQAITLQKPDRVPVMLPVGSYPAWYAGMTLHDIMYDYEKLRRAWLKFKDEFELDTFSAPLLTFPGRVLDAVGNNLQKWPGHGLPIGVSMSQFVENEYMKADEYDAYLRDPLEYYLCRFLPRAWDAFKPLQELEPHLAGYDLPYRILSLCARPEFMAACKTLGAAAEEYGRWWEVVKDIRNKIIASGIPPLRGAMTQAPFDHFGDTLRGTKGIFGDIYRQPGKLLQAMDEIIPRSIDKIVASGEHMASPVVFMPLHKGDDTFMSVQQFKTYYWPQLKKLLLGMIEEGFVPYLFAEGKYNTRLEIIADLPRGSVIWHFDQTDMVKAKAILGNTACIAGNVPSSLLYTGPAAAVKSRCLELITICGKGGGYILTGGASIDKGDPANLRAMIEAAREHGDA
jgi:uroporphyrinogen-III decarboxylase